jgi:hypothetical protein
VEASVAGVVEGDDAEGEEAPLEEGDGVFGAATARRSPRNWSTLQPRRLKHDPGDAVAVTTKVGDEAGREAGSLTQRSLRMPAVSMLHHDQERCSILRDIPSESAAQDRNMVERHARADRTQ